ncbi:NUMOD1 domain-containing DNA-binding protein [Staphylococcus agnetis]|uniref:NUMOD1 domain-containing DNA-binding protein n=2 Tax=Staphylococcus TaxID=1279 RepID=UPI001056FC30|nr:NUMOD1 domain-containing DNA-binding protein [Staphylococcus agnetis]
MEKKGLDHRDSSSKEYHRKYAKALRRTKKGHLTQVYYGMKIRNKNKGFGKLPFTLTNFVEKYINSYEFVVLYEAYKKNNYEKVLAPSIDRINPKLGYFFENMQFITWNENKLKGEKERKIISSKPVNMYDYETGELIMKFSSAFEAAKYTGFHQGNIVKNLKGRRNKVGGCKFKYVEREESDIYLKIKELLNKE